MMVARTIRAKLQMPWQPRMPTFGFITMKPIKGWITVTARGVELATKAYVGWAAGNNLNPRKGLEDAFDAIGQADVVVPYVVNDVRPLARRIISRTVVKTLGLLFGLKLKYYTGPCVYRSADIKQVKITSQGSIALAEILIRLIRSGRSYVEVGLNTKKRIKRQI